MANGWAKAQQQQKATEDAADEIPTHLFPINPQRKSQRLGNKKYFSRSNMSEWTCSTKLISSFWRRLTRQHLVQFLQTRHLTTLKTKMVKEWCHGTRVPSPNTPISNVWNMTEAKENYQSLELLSLSFLFFLFPIIYWTWHKEGGPIPVHAWYTKSRWIRKNTTCANESPT